MKFLLFPFTVLYAIGIGFRNLLYNIGILKSKPFSLPVILVGNLSVGGTGKTPHVELLCRILQSEKFSCAVLSRGYGRKTSGTLEVNPSHTAADVGDEPLQVRRKFPSIPVFVDGNRKRGIKKIRATYPDIKVILMDDGFQHRRVKPGLAFLLRDYNLLDQRQYLLPMGRLREPLSAGKRADHIIITKTPDFFSPMEKRIIREEVKYNNAQEVFFTYMHYGDLHSVADNGKPSFFNMEYYAEREYDIMLFAGIARPEPLLHHLKKHFRTVESVFYTDHHWYSDKDVQFLLRKFREMPGDKKILVTTEKDAMRLFYPDILPLFADTPLFFIPIEARFHHDEKDKFSALLMEYLRRSYPVNPGRFR